MEESDSRTFIFVLRSLCTIALASGSMSHKSRMYLMRYIHRNSSVKRRPSEAMELLSNLQRDSWIMNEAMDMNFSDFEKHEVIKEVFSFAASSCECNQIEANIVYKVASRIQFSFGEMIELLEKYDGDRVASLRSNLMEIHDLLG